ncbi:MAG: hypothetical protein M3503_01940 [Actinomycetota bacterium]|nr:hypothetical protein [Actinomycetota bacterium]
MDGARARVLIAVRPVVLEGAFAAILHSIGLDEVVQFHGATAAERAGRFGAAVISADLAGAVAADVVITLPDTGGAGASGEPRRGHVTSGDGSVEVDIRDERQVIDLLDEHVPMTTSRRDGLLARARSLT